MANGELACYDFAGKEIWRFNVADRYGKLNIAFGMTSSPVLDGDRIYLQLLHTGAKLVVALDKATGKDIWQAVRPSDARDECLHSYASPIVYRDGQREFLLTHGSDYIVAHNLRDGAELWRCGGLNSPSKYNATLRFVASPAAIPGLIVVPSAKNGPVLGLTPAGAGNITGDAKTHTWVREQNTPDVPSPVISDGLVYLCRENGVLICMDAKTGEEIYQERCYSDRYRASPVAADGKIYCVSRKGVATVVKAGRTFEKLAENDIGDAVSASPVISNGKIYLRGFENLYCIGK
jgi:outer membrane protein assembly factor BamB